MAQPPTPPHAKMPHKDIDPKGFHGSVERQQNGLRIATSPKLRLFRFGNLEKWDICCKKYPNICHIKEDDEQMVCKFKEINFRRQV